MITVICSRCGGTGKLEFLDSKPPYRNFLICPECKGAGEVQELSFEERKKLKASERSKTLQL